MECVMKIFILNVTHALVHLSELPLTNQDQVSAIPCLKVWLGFQPRLWRRWDEETENLMSPSLGAAWRIATLEPERATTQAARSLIVVWFSVPTLKAPEVALSELKIVLTPATKSETNTKSLVCSPSPKIVRSLPDLARPMKTDITPV